MPSIPEPSDILSLVKASPHWRVRIVPSIFEPTRIPDPPACWKIMESCAVSLRGWDYPHVDRTDRQNGYEWVASWCDFMGHREYWRLFQSGQFVHLFSFWEDDDPNNLRRALQKALVVPTGAQPTGCVDVIGMLYRFTEIYEFASRCAQKMALAGTVSISVELVNVKSRILTALEFSRGWCGYYPAMETNLLHVNDVPAERLAGSAPELAIDETIWFFHRFQWNDPNPGVLQNDQSKLLSRNLR